MIKIHLFPITISAGPRKDKAKFDSPITFWVPSQQKIPLLAPNGVSPWLYVWLTELSWKIPVVLLRHGKGDFNRYWSLFFVYVSFKLTVCFNWDHIVDVKLLASLLWTRFGWFFSFGISFCISVSLHIHAYTHRVIKIWLRIPLFFVTIYSFII